MSNHWHRPDREKSCTACGESKRLGEFYAYPYTTRQGKESVRYESRCKPCARSRRVDQYHSDPVRAKAVCARWREKNGDHLTAYRRERQQNPDVRALKACHQRLRKARARANASDGPEIRAIYSEAMRLERLIANCPVFDLPELGKKLHVDHIVPLSRGGAHTPSNLQILAAGLNLRKGASCPA